MSVKMKLVPRKVGRYTEMVEILSESNGEFIYPTAFFHIDTFWQGDDDREMYDRLNDGEDIIVELNIVEKK